MEKTNNNIKWYEDKELAIFFDSIPKVAVRYIVPSMTKLERQGVKRYPFINKRDLKVAIFDKKKEKCYKFKIRKDYCYDGCTIPRFAWSLIGVSKENNCGLIASLIHDYLTTNRDLINNDRALSTNIFNALLIAGDMNLLKRFIMKNCVACYQTLFCDWGLEYNKNG